MSEKGLPRAILASGRRSESVRDVRTSKPPTLEITVPPDEKDPDRSELAKYLGYSHVGLQFFLSIGLFTGGGIWLDRRLGTVVLFTLVGLALGFAGGLYSLYREVFLKKKPGDEADSDDRNTGPGPRSSNAKKT